MPAAAMLLALALMVSGASGAGGAESPADPQGGIELRALKFDQWQQVLEQQRGSIAVVDIWASWCAPCIERFPHMVEMYHRYRDRGVRFLSLNLDEAGDVESLQWAEAFLRRVAAVFPNYHMDEKMLEAFRRLELQALPVVLIYAADGAEVYRLTGDDPNNQFDESDVEAAILTLLNEHAGAAGTR